MLYKKKPYPSKKADQFGKEVPGATLKLTGKTYDGKDITINASQVSGGSNVSESDGAVTWVSTDKDTVISDIADGVYTLTETLAPASGDYLKSETVTFDVTDGKVVCIFNRWYRILL